MTQSKVGRAVHLTADEIQKQRALKKAENLKKWDHDAAVQHKAMKKLKGRALKAQKELTRKQKYPHDVVITSGRFATPETKNELRQWFWTQNIIAFHANDDDVIDVIWDTNWQKFSFRKPEHVMMFQLVYA